MTAALSDPVTLSADRLHALAPVLGGGGFPTVLAMWSRQTYVDWGDTSESGNGPLVAHPEVDDHATLTAMLHALDRPDREFAVRLVTPAGTARISIVRRGSLGVLARRVGDNITLRILGYRIEAGDMVSALMAELPSARPADIESVGAPLSELSECLSGTNDSVELSDRIRALGPPARTAMMLGAALASRQAFAEIVHYILRDERGTISRSPAAVAVFYTKRGCILGVPSVSPSGQPWTTLKAGSDHALSRAIGGFVELCESGWGDA